MDSVVALAKKLRDGEMELGINTGLSKLDRIIGGYYRGKLVTIAGRPGMGKSVVLTKDFHLPRS
jgi:replicative DNA helicase